MKPIRIVQRFARITTLRDSMLRPVCRGALLLSLLSSLNLAFATDCRLALAKISLNQPVIKNAHQAKTEFLECLVRHQPDARKQLEDAVLQAGLSPIEHCEGKPACILAFNSLARIHLGRLLQASNSDREEQTALIREGLEDKQAFLPISPENIRGLIGRFCGLAQRISAFPSNDPIKERYQQMVAKCANETSTCQSHLPQPDISALKDDASLDEIPDERDEVLAAARDDKIVAAISHNKRLVKFTRCLLGHSHDISSDSESGIHSWLTCFSGFSALASRHETALYQYRLQHADTDEKVRLQRERALWEKTVDRSCNERENFNDPSTVGGSLWTHLDGSRCEVGAIAARILRLHPPEPLKSKYEAILQYFGTEPSYLYDYLVNHYLYGDQQLFRQAFREQKITPFHDGASQLAMSAFVSLSQEHLEAVLIQAEKNKSGRQQAAAIRKEREKEIPYCPDGRVDCIAGCSAGDRYDEFCANVRDIMRLNPAGWLKPRYQALEHTCKITKARCQHLMPHCIKDESKSLDSQECADRFYALIDCLKGLPDKNKNSAD